MFRRALLLVVGVPSLLPLCLAAMAATAAYASDLVIAEKGKTDYRIVIPDRSQDEIVDHWLLITAKLMQAAFEKNGFKIEVVKEGAASQGKPGIYLGATDFARNSAVLVDQHDDWTYHVKAVGKDLIIAGNDKRDPDRARRGRGAPLALLGTVKGACDFLRTYAGVRFLFMNMDESIYTPRRDGAGAFNADGSLKIDPRSIAFTPVEKIAVAADPRKESDPAS